MYFFTPSPILPDTRGTSPGGLPLDRWRRPPNDPPQESEARPVDVVEACKAWFADVENYRRQEDKHFDRGTIETVRQQQRMFLSDCINHGERLAYIAKVIGLGSGLADFTVADIEATVALLRVDFACQFGPKPTAERAARIARLLSGEK